MPSPAGSAFDGCSGVLVEAEEEDVGDESAWRSEEEGGEDRRRRLTRRRAIEVNAAAATFVSRGMAGMVDGSRLAQHDGAFARFD